METTLIALANTRPVTPSQGAVNGNENEFTSMMEASLTKKTENYHSETGQHLIEIGSISGENPTVSHLLKNHKDYENRAWNIIFSEQNQQKPFRSMPKGTVVFLNQETEELSWKGAKPQFNEEIAFGNASMSPVVSSPSNVSSSNQVIGTISEENPTVSHLFKNNQEFQGNYWNIIMSPVNQDQPYDKLRPGTVVSLDPTTNKLHFERSSGGNVVQESSNTMARSQTYEPLHVSSTPAFVEPEISMENLNFQEKLAESAKQYIGRPYSEIDCYGLVVRGLANQGIQYQGKGGLRQQLESMAVDKGLPANAYLTGEGLVSTNGTTLYSKTVMAIKNPSSTAEKVFQEIQPILEKGQVLSFSTPSRGHTGIVSKKDDSWTYINSGLIDNNVTKSSRISRKVGEEVLKEEMENWLSLARSRREPLKITVGRLEESKLRSFSQKAQQRNKVSQMYEQNMPEFKPFEKFFSPDSMDAVLERKRAAARGEDIPWIW